MLSSTESHELLHPLVGIAAIVIIISRLIRWARLCTPTGLDTQPSQTPPPIRRPLWGPGRKLDKLNQNTALARAEAELLHTTIDQVQAQHSLDRLMTELAPALMPARHVPDGAALPSLTLPEIRAVLASIDMPGELRGTLFQLLEATANEKTGQ